jgi:hypothetical protein
VYKITSKKPSNGQKIFIGSNIVLTHLFVGLMDDRLEKVLVRIYWYDFESLEVYDANLSKLINKFTDKDLFDMPFLKNWNPCDF